MNRVAALGILGCLCAAVLGSGCTTADTGGAVVKSLYIGPAMQDGTGPRPCLMAKESPEAVYALFCRPIAGFDYVPGFEYQLLTEVSGDSYALKKIVSKEPAGLGLGSCVWEMAEYLSAGGAMEPRLEKSMVNLQVTPGGISGSAGANKFFGSVTLDGSSIHISAAGSTMMMGTPELMAQEDQFLKHLLEARQYQMVGGELRLLNGEGRVTLKFKPRVEPVLTSGVWRAVGVNNGRGGVASVIRGTEITIQFRADGNVFGSSGCNSFMGGYEIDGGSIQFGPQAGTRSLCAGPAGIMEQEQVFLRALERAVLWKIHDDALELRDADGALLARFEIMK